MSGFLKSLRAAIGLYVALRPSGRELIRIAWGGLDARGRLIFAREIRQAIAVAWAAAKNEADPVKADDSPGDVSVEYAAAMLGISIPIVRHRMDSGRLRFEVVDGARRIKVADVIKLKEFEDRRRMFAAALGADTEELEPAERKKAPGGEPEA